MWKCFTRKILSRQARTWVALFFLFSSRQEAFSQLVRFEDSVAAYNVHRINMGITGNKVLGCWGLASTAGGAIMYFAGQGTEVKDFGAMTFAWGLAHTGVAALRLGRLGAEPVEHINAEVAYGKYEQAKRRYLVSAGLDVMYIAAGEGLLLYGKQQGADRFGYYGCGKAMASQGIFLLCLDYVLFSAHLLDHSKWYRLMNELRFTGRQVGLVMVL